MLLCKCSCGRPFCASEETYGDPPWKEEFSRLIRQKTLCEVLSIVDEDLEYFDKHSKDVEASRHVRMIDEERYLLFLRLREDIVLLGSDDE